MIGPQFWPQFWPDLLATLIGAFFGVVLAGWYNRRQERRARESEERDLLLALRENLTINLQVMVKLKECSTRRARLFQQHRLTLGYSMLSCRASLRSPRTHGLQLRSLFCGTRSTYSTDALTA